METWKTIPSLGNAYEASNEGQVRRSKKNRGTRVGRVLSVGTMKSGYKTVCAQHNGKTTTRLVHRLVAEAFLGPSPDGHEVNHKDCNKANNNVENLEYVTRSENLLHASKKTGAYRGSRNSQAVINESIAVEIRRMHSAGLGYKKLSKHFDLPWHIVRSVAARITWKHLP